MHLRPPAFSPGFTYFVGGVSLGLFIWIGLLAVGVGLAPSLLAGLVGGALIFFYVRLYGRDQLNR